MRIKPAEHVIKVFKGVRAAARAIERSPGSVSKWRKTGNIPADAMRKIMELAHQNKLDITANDLVYGRIINERKKAR